MDLAQTCCVEMSDLNDGSRTKNETNIYNWNAISRFVCIYLCF